MERVGSGRVGCGVAGACMQERGFVEEENDQVKGVYQSALVSNVDAK